MRRHFINSVMSSWKPILLLLGSLALCAVFGLSDSVLAQTQATDPSSGDPETCAILGAPYIRMSRDETIARRVPRIEGSAIISNRCEGILKAQLAQWQQEDESDWIHTRNRYCSAKLGWVEYHPGTCQAGGPPPICPVNHWYRNFYSSADELHRLEADNDAKRESRATELAKLRCQCSVEDARTADELQPTSKAPKAPGALSYIPDSTGISLRCTSTAECERMVPGYTCIQGVCRYAKMSGEGLDEASEEFIKHYVEEQHTRLSEMFSNFWVKIFLDVVKPTLVSTYSDSYARHKHSLQLLEDEVPRDINKLRETSVNSSDYTQLRSRLDDIHAQMIELVQRLNEDEVGIVTEREFGNRACYDMLSYQHRKAMDQTTKLATYIGSLKY